MADAMTLNDLCEELKLDSRVTRIKLREAVKSNPDLAAIHKPRTIALAEGLHRRQIYPQSCCLIQGVISER